MTPVSTVTERLRLSSSPATALLLLQLLLLLLLLVLLLLLTALLLTALPLLPAIRLLPGTIKSDDCALNTVSALYATIGVVAGRMRSSSLSESDISGRAIADPALDVTPLVSGRGPAAASESGAPSCSEPAPGNL